MSNALLESGTLLTPLTVVDLTVDGGAIARHEGRVVFLDRGLPQEVVSAHVVEDKKRLIHAVVAETLQASPLAEKAWCPHYALCGGCSWQDMKPEAVLAWKEQHVRQTLARIGKVENIPVAPIQQSPVMREYRNKMAYAFAPETSEGGLCLGLRQRASHAVVSVTHCGMQPPEAMQILAQVREEAQRLGLPAWNGYSGVLRFLVIRMPVHLRNGVRQLHVECITSAQGAGAPYAKALQELATILLAGEIVTGFAHTIRSSSADVAQGERLVFTQGHVDVEEKIGETLLTAPFPAFLQTNTRAAELLYAQVASCLALTGTENIWDLYCGVGGIGLSLASKAASVHGFEIDKEAVRAAKQNSRILGYANCRFTYGDIANTLREYFKSGHAMPDCLVADPPRAGLDARVVELLEKIQARTFVYVSCDVATQARDITRLASAWQPVQAFPVDMFPHTPHVESIVVFSRKDAA